VGQLHNELRRGPLSNALSAAVGDTRGGGLERYGETLDPVIDLWEKPEWAFLRGENLCGFVRSQAAVAAEFGVVGLANPAGSDMIVVAEFAEGRGAAFDLEMSSDDALIATAAVATGGVSRDRRNPAPNFLSRALLRTGSDAASIGQPIDEKSDSEPMKNLPVILPPGQALILRALTVNVAVVTIWGWRERTAFPGELG